MKILLTGSTGLLGAHILEQGLTHGHQFILPHRKISKRSYLSTVIENPAISLIEADLAENLPEEMFENVDIIINCAALASPFEEDLAKMELINTEIPTQLYTSGVQSGVSHFIQISSTSVLGTCRNTPYARTKKAFDSWLEKQSDISHSLIHPGFMLGKYDSRPSSGAIFLAIKMGKFKHYTEGEKNIVAASDVAAGIFKMINSNVSGNFILGGTNIEIPEFLKESCEMIDRAFSDLKMISSDEIEEFQIEREFCLTGPVSSEKAIKEFGYEIRLNPSQCIKESLEWFQDKKMMRIKK